MAAYSLLKDVSETSQNLCICTRIGRLWEHVKNNKIIMLHMVLVDEKGEGIHACVHEDEIPLFHLQLKEGEVYYFRRFKTRRVKLSIDYRSAVHTCELHFKTWTTVAWINPQPADFPLYAYHPRMFENIMCTVMDKTYLADVLGFVKGISDIKTLKKPRRTVILNDGRNDAIINMWGELATQLNADELICRSQSEPVILLAMGCKYKMDDSMLSLSPAYGCRICINPPSDISAFRNRISGLDHSIERIDDRGQRLGASVVENTSATNIGSSSDAPHTGFRVDVVSACDSVAEPTVSTSQEHNAGTLTNLFSEGSSSDAPHTGSRVNAMSARDPVAEPTVSASQEHNADLSSSVDPQSPEISEPACGEMPRTPAVGKKRATPPGDVLATASGLKRKTRSSSKGGDNLRKINTRSSSMGGDKQRGQIEAVKKKPGKAPKKPSNHYLLFKSEFTLNYQLARPNHVISEEAAEKWKCMTKDEKSPYTSQYKEHLEEYEKLMAEYKRLLNAYDNSHLAEYERHLAEYERNLAEYEYKRNLVENVPGIEIGIFGANDAFDHLLASTVDKPEGGHTGDQEEGEHERGCEVHSGHPPAWHLGARGAAGSWRPRGAAGSSCTLYRQLINCKGFS